MGDMSKILGAGQWPISPARLRRRFDMLPNYVILILVAVFVLGPLLVLIFNSFKSNMELGQDPLGPPSQLHWENFSNAWVQGNFGTTMRNSLILVISTVVGVLALGGLAAYSLARLDLPGANAFTIYMLGLSSVPVWIYIVPLFTLLHKLGLLNSLVGLIIVYIAIRSPFSIFLLRSYLLQIPQEFDDAARVDGASELQVLTKIILPIMWPGFLTVGLVVALEVWSEFQLALIFISQEELMPVTTSYNNFNKRFGTDWSLTNAGAVLMIAPIIVLFLALQRRFIEGLSQGGMKT
jgi:raffinose/stachyose/melibiose transport system permease protein